jgi:predicted nucleic acid-binding protein
VPFTVLYDANVLYPNALRDLLIRLAQGPGAFVHARWSDSILDEVFRSLRRNRPNLDPALLVRTRALMNRSIREVLVTGYQPLIDVLDLPDPDDRHVLAAAIKASAQIIVTNNVRDFPTETLTPWNIEAKDADTFVLDQICFAKSKVYSRVQQIADSRRNPPCTIEDVLRELERCGLLQATAALRA